MQHIIYIPGLGDRYDVIRRLGLKLWRRRSIRVSHFPMNWLDPTETLESKLERLNKVITKYPDHQVTLVGESAGGAMALVAFDRFKDVVDKTVTLCGMNRGVNGVSPALFKRNRAFFDAIVAAEQIISRLTSDDKDKLHVIYSSGDITVRPKNSLIPGVSSYDLKTPGHMFAILDVLFFRYSIITKRQ